MPTPRMTTIQLLAAATLLALAGTSAAQKTTTSKKLYCWDDHGHKVCGDALPAEASGSLRAEFSAKSGRHVGDVAAALTAEERAAAAIAEKAAAAQAESDAARQRREMAMAESYATETDLRKAFQERIDLLDETLKASELGVTGLRQSLVGLLRQAGELELAGKPVPPTTAGNITTQHTELRRRERILAQQRVDRARLDSELAAVLQRYREIKAPATVPSATGAAPPSS